MLFNLKAHGIAIGEEFLAKDILTAVRQDLRAPEQAAEEGTADRLSS